MRYAVIADVHGNYPALQAVLQDAKKAGAEQFLFLGDYMTDFPFTREIVAVLRSLPHAVFVSGNREWYLDSLDPAQRGLEQYAALFLTWDALRPEELAWVKQLPRTAKPPHAGRGADALSTTRISGGPGSPGTENAGFRRVG